MTMAGQFRFARTTLEPLAPLIRSGAQMVVTHGNGPQVGYILTRVEKALGSAYSLPLEVCVAESEGELGYVLQQTLHNLGGGARSVITLLTQVKVDTRDPAFDRPTKPIGPFLNQDAAGRLKTEGLPVVEDAGRGFRRVVPSPRPVEIVEIEVIRTLLGKGVIVIAAGGGGIPVVETQNGLEGVEAVIDKDFATLMLAREVSADKMVLVTSVDGAYTDFGTPRARRIGQVTADAMKSLMSEGHFAEGSMGPKVAAAIEFVETTGRPAVICQPSDLAAATELEAGTCIVPGRARK